VPVCQYCFRGLPMVLLLFGTPLLTWLLVRLVRAVLPRTRTTGGEDPPSGHHHHHHYDLLREEDGMGPGVRAPDYVDGGAREVEADLEAIQEAATPSHGEEAGPEEEEQQQEGGIVFHRGARPSTTAELLSHLGCDPRENVLVVVCGPPGLEERTWRDLEGDPLRRHWRVVVAS